MYVQSMYMKCITNLILDLALIPANGGQYRHLTGQAGVGQPWHTGTFPLQWRHFGPPHWSSRISNKMRLIEL
jgi:hypothetical protein